MFALGVAQVEKRDGSIEGRRCVLIDYTGKVIVSDKEEKQRIKEESNRVRGFISKRAPWYQADLPKDYDPKHIWDLDSPENLTQI